MGGRRTALRTPCRKFLATPPLLEGRLLLRSLAPCRVLRQAPQSDSDGSRLNLLRKKKLSDFDFANVVVLIVISWSDNPFCRSSNASYCSYY